MKKASKINVNKRPSRGEKAPSSRDDEFSLIVNSLPALAWSARPDGSAEFFNQHYLSYVGLLLEQLQGAGWAAAVYPDDLGALVAKWQSIMSSGKPGETEARLRRFDGVYRWFLFRANPMRDESGSIIKWVGINTDIEDRKRAQEALSARERDLRSIINTIPTMAWTARPDGYCDFLNQRWLDYVGMTPDQALGWGWAAAIHPDDRNGLLEVWQSRLASGEAIETEARLRHRDGAYRWFLFRANPVRDESGCIVKWYGTSIDFQDRKKVEDALRASEFSWRQIVDNIPGFVATMGAMGEVEFLNRQTLEYFGKTNEELKNWSLIGAVHADDLPRIVEARAKSIESGQVYEVEHRCRRYDGIYRWFQVRGLPVRNTAGEITAWYLLLTDIDDRKRAEEALHARELDARSLLDNMPGFLGRHSPDGTPEIVNRPFLHYQGRTVEEIGQWQTSDVVHPDDLAHVIKVSANGVSGGQPWVLEFRLRRFDGAYRWFEARWVPVRDAEGRILHWNALTTDIDDRKNAEKALEASQRNLSLLINAIRIYIVVLRPDGSVEYVNQVVLDYHGATLQDVQEKGYRPRFFHPEDIARVSEERQKGLTRGVPFENEQRLLRKDGTYRWFLVRYDPLLDQQGKIDRWYVAATDIEDRKQAEAQLEQAYLRLAQAQQLSKTGSFITDLLQDEHDWSEEAFRIFEFDPAAKVTVQKIRDVIHPGDLPSFDAVIARGMTGADVDFVFRIVTPRGAVKHIRGMARVIEQITRRPLFIGALQDVTQSKAAEEALDRARSELAQVARITTLNTLTASIAHEVNQPLSGIITNASTCLRMLNGDPPNIDGARETGRRIIRDGNRASDVITRLRALFSKKEFTLELLDLNLAAQEVIALSLNDLQRNRVTLRLELPDDLPPVSGDRVQLQQVILNLIRNACDAMSAVEEHPRELLIKTERDEKDRVCLIVKDAGVGFTPEAAEKLFEAFYTTKPDGMGIGLSVSRSIIEAHHGRLWATPNDGPGASFSFCLPCPPNTKVQ